MSGKDPDALLWLDLETTGSDETKGDCIIEVGAILTTPDLIALGEFSAVVQPTAEGLGRLLLNPVVRAMHETNGLLADVLALKGDPLHKVARSLLDFIAYSDPPGEVAIAGSGVGHFDRRFIARWMPEVDRRLLYWPFDTGTLRRAHRFWLGADLSSANGRKTHRALDDIRCHLEEARAFRDLWRSQAVMGA